MTTKAEGGELMESHTEALFWEEFNFANDGLENLAERQISALLANALATKMLAEQADRIRVALNELPIIQGQ